MICPFETLYTPSPLNVVSVLLPYKLYEYAEYMEDHKAEGGYKVSKG